MAPTTAPSESPTALLYPIYLYVETGFTMTYTALLDAVDQTSLAVFGFDVHRSQMLVSLQSAHTDRKSWVIRIVTAFAYTGDLTGVVDSSFTAEARAHTGEWVITTRGTYGDQEYDITCDGVEAQFVGNACCATTRYECSRLATMYRGMSCRCGE